jgi:serine O-acetyltransferase
MIPFLGRLNTRRRVRTTKVLSPSQSLCTAIVLVVASCVHHASAWVQRAISQRPMHQLFDSLSFPDNMKNSTLDVDDLWGAAVNTDYSNPYRSTLLTSIDAWEAFKGALEQRAATENVANSMGDDKKCSRLAKIDPFWEQIKLEAETALRLEPQAGPQLYQGILSQPTLMSAICTVVSHEIETELIPATTLKNLFMELLTPEDEYCIRQDLQAVASRSPSIEHAMDAILFQNGFHALVCYRVGHRLWQANRTSLAYYMQSTVSRKYSADIHPACVMGSGIYIRVGAGVVIGETAVVGDDVSILEGVTLGGTGKEAGDRHPKVGNGVIVQDGGTVLGNIPVGEGSVVTAKSIVTKPVPPLAIVSGVPAKIQSYRDLHESSFDCNLQRHLVIKYLDRWRVLYDDLYSTKNQL